MLVDSVSQMNSYLTNNHVDTAYYMSKKNLKFDYEVPGYSKELMFTYIPSHSF